MGRILGLGVTHSPPRLSAAGDTASRIKHMMQDPLLPDIEEHGHQETLNWLLMLGAMAELGGRKPQEARFVESWLTNANKVFAVFRP